ncbi:ubiquitin-like domain-containing protein CIP73 isoform X2 [Jatropha curcas]|uniref:ubiquitin-like domain-containing protein CIP73 isoform X2 n=1 Tax=Jatropha curcas TaxID=180498 RepID=UPI0009D7764E|nr:ubiquitin-like domain-containing protein CIP73 isoform X2 [Jatropha curcas]
MASGNHGSNCSEATVEIKIKTLDSQTYTLRVDKCVPVPELKEQIATVTGVLSEQQRLICRGRVLKDDQLLSAYHVEDGHTLHLVVRQPFLPSSDSLPNNDPGPSVLVGAFSEEGDGVFSSFNQIFSAILSSIVVGSGSEGFNLREPSNNGLVGSSGQHHQATLQPPVILESLTTLSQYLNHLRHEFGPNVDDENNSNFAATHGRNVQNSETVLPSTAGQEALARPASLAEVLLSTRQLLIEQVADCLSQLAQLLEDQENVMDLLAWASVQTNSLRSGVLLQNLGALLLELGRITMTLRLGETPADAVVNAGPPVFISAFGPNPMMVQPLSFQPGASYGTTPIGTAEVLRNRNVRIQAGSLMPSVNANEREPSTGETNPPLSGGSNSLHQATAVPSGNPPSIRVSDVQVVPIRAVITAVTAPVRQNPDLSHSSMGLSYPVLAPVQQLNSEATDTTSNSHPSSDHNHNVPIHVGGGINFQGTASNSQPPEAAANTQEATVDNEGAFLSNVLQQIMPFIDQDAALGSSRIDSGNMEALTQASESDVGASSRARIDPSSPRPSKRQKRE